MYNDIIKQGDDFIKRKADYIKIYEIIAGVILLASTVMLLLNPEVFYESLDSEIGSLIFDFKSHIMYTADLKNTYNTTMHACFPPLIYLFYHFLYLIVPTSGTTDEYGAMLDFTYMIYLAVLIVIFACVCSKMLEKESRLNRMSVTLLIVLSTSFVYGIIEQGNIVLLPMMLLAVAALWRDSKNKIKRELALVFIAVAAGIKVYPAVFGIIYLAEKRYKEAIRLIAYGILFFFVPFAFTGGLDGFKTFLANQSNVHQAWGFRSIISVYSYAKFFNLSENAGIVLMIVFALAALVLAFLAKKQWQKYFMISFIMVMCPMWSGQYTVCFFLIPFFAFLRANEHNRSEKIYNAFYITMFSLMFSASLFGRFLSGVKMSMAAIVIFTLSAIQIITDINFKKALPKQQN